MHAQALRTLLIVSASIATAFALLQSLQLLNPDAKSLARHAVAQMTTARLIVAPLCGGAALVFAAQHRVPQAIMALAALVVSLWIGELVMTHVTGDMLTMAVPTAITVAASVMAICRVRLGLAAALVAGMWLLWFCTSFWDVLVLGVGMIIYS